MRVQLSVSCEINFIISINNKHPIELLFISLFAGLGIFSFFSKGPNDDLSGIPGHVSWYYC